MLLALKWIVLILLGLAFCHLVLLRIVRHIYHFPAPAFATRLIDNPFRRKFIQNPETIARRMKLEPGMIALDLGPGKGSYTRAVAENAGPKGLVLAVDIQEAVLLHLKHRMQDQKMDNIRCLAANAYGFPLADASVDRVLSIACVPEIPDPVAVLLEFGRIIKPGGLICLCELFPDPDYPLRSTEKRWAKEAGLLLVEEFGNWFTYQLHFTRRS